MEKMMSMIQNNESMIEVSGVIIVILILVLLLYRIRSLERWAGMIDHNLRKLTEGLQGVPISNKEGAEYEASAPTEISSDVTNSPKKRNTARYGAPVNTRTGTIEEKESTTWYGTPVNTRTGRIEEKGSTAWYGTPVNTRTGTIEKKRNTARYGTPVNAKTGTIEKKRNTAWYGTPVNTRTGTIEKKLNRNENEKENENQTEWEKRSGLEKKEDRMEEQQNQVINAVLEEIFS